MNITTLRAAAEQIVSEELGAEYRALPYQFEIDQNDSRSLAAGFAVVWGQGSQVQMIDQSVNIEQDLDVTVTRRIFVRNDDAKTISETDDVYTAIGAVIKRFVMDKIDQAGIVQRVELSSMGKPERPGNGRDFIAIPLTFRVRYLI